MNNRIIDGKVTNYQGGLSEKELVEIADFKPIPKWYEKLSFGDSEQYGMSTFYKKWACYPSFLPVWFILEHGPSMRDKYEKRYHTIGSPAFCLSTKSRVDQMRENGYNAYTIEYPFVTYGRKVMNPSRKKTNKAIYFVSHSSGQAIVEHNHDEILAELKQNFKGIDISICIFYQDIQKGIHKTYLDAGYKVVSAGSRHNRHFMENFFELIKDIDYCITDDLGSHVLYCAYFDIPVSIIGKQPEKNLWDDPNFDDDMILYQHIYNTFKGYYKEVTEEQKEIAIQNLGVSHGISKAKFSYLLYKNLFYYPIFSIKNKIANRFFNVTLKK